MDKMNEYRLVYKTSVIDNELKDVESIEKYYKQSMELKDLYN